MKFRTRRGHFHSRDDGISSPDECRSGPGRLYVRLHPLVAVRTTFISKPRRKTPTDTGVRRAEHVEQEMAINVKPGVATEDIISANSRFPGVWTCF